MLKKLTIFAILTILVASLTVMPTMAYMPQDCDEFLSGGGQGAGLGCIDWVIFMYESAGPWDGTFEPGGYGEWPTPPYDW